MSHEVSQFNSEQNSIALNNASITGGGKMSAEHTPGPRQKGYIWVDDDGFIAHGTGDDYITVAEIIKPEHVEPLTKIIDSHDALLEACKELLGDWWCARSSCQNPECRACQNAKADKLRYETIIAQAE